MLYIGIINNGEKMVIKKQVNKAVIEIDFESIDSIQDTLDFVLFYGHIYSDKIDIKGAIFDKIQLIKLVRQFGQECVDRENAGQRGAGLALAKNFVNNNMMKFVKQRDG